MYLSKKRIALMCIISIILIIVLSIRLGYVQFYKSKMINNLADELWTRDIPVYGYRGNIYDCNGKLIVGNKLTPSIACIPNQVKNKKEVSEQLSEILECDKDDILKHLTKNVSVELIKPEGRRITKEQATLITDLMIDGIYVVGDSKRYYPYGDLLCHVLGFCGSDNQGITGIEYIYNDYLTGGNGYLEIYTDAKGNIMSGLNGMYKQSSKGFDIYLTINIDVQIALENIIDNAVSQYNPENISVLATDVNSSKVLAMASYPTYDMENYLDYDIETYNRNLPIWKCYEPGSTFKICTYAMGLEEKVFNINDTFNCSGGANIDGSYIKDWKSGGHGHQTFLEVIQNECNSSGFMDYCRID